MTKKQLILTIADVLNRYKFRQENTLWNRNYTNFVDVIDLQISKSKNMFTINVGVADRFVVCTCWGLTDTDIVDEPSCTVRARLGQLLYERDVWWNLSDSEGIAEAVRGIENVAIPFLKLNHRIDSILEYLENDPATRRYPPGVIYLALLHYRLGESALSRKILKSANLTDAWSKKASDIINVLNQISV